MKENVFPLVNSIPGMIYVIVKRGSDHSSLFAIKAWKENYGSSQYSVGKSWIAAAGLDSAGPHPLIPSPTRKDTRERAYPRRCCSMRASGEMGLLYIFHIRHS